MNDDEQSRSSDGIESTAISPPPPPGWRVWRWKMHWQILLGIAVGLAIGWISGVNAEDGSAPGLGFYDFLGGLFISGLKMLIVPLITASIINAMIGLGKEHGFARMGGKTLLFYVCSSILAILVGLILVNLIAPGSGVGETIAASPGGEREAANAAAIQSKTADRTAGDFLGVFEQMVPPNIVEAAVAGNLLGLIIFSMLFGFAAGRVPGEAGRAVARFFDGFSQVMERVTDMVLRVAPIGIAFLIATTTADAIADEVFVERIGQLILFVITVLLALGIHAFVTMFLILKFVARVRPLAHLRAMVPAMLTAFSTASSAATLPLTMECVEENSGVSRRSAGFVLPLGATVNMDGTALYECIAVLFVCQLHGIDLTFGQQFFVVAMALLTSIGVAGVPSASLVAIVVILTAIGEQIGVPLGMEAIAIILIFDRVLDMCRTAVNIWGDSCGAVTIARSEGEETKVA